MGERGSGVCFWGRCWRVRLWILSDCLFALQSLTSIAVKSMKQYTGDTWAVLPLTLALWTLLLIRFLTQHLLTAGEVKTQQRLQSSWRPIALCGGCLHQYTTTKTVLHASKKEKLVSLSVKFTYCWMKWGNIVWLLWVCVFRYLSHSECFNSLSNCRDCALRFYFWFPKKWLINNKMV